MVTGTLTDGNGNQSKDGAADVGGFGLVGGLTRTVLWTFRWLVSLWASGVGHLARYTEPDPRVAVSVISAY